VAEGLGKRLLNELGIDDTGMRAIGWLTAGIGIYSGYALFLMLWAQQQQGETVLKFLLALGAAAGMSFAFEILRSVIEGANHHWSFPRVMATIVMLAAFELFIIATDSAVGLGASAAVGVAGFVFGEQFADTVNPGWNLAALGGLWLVVALAMVGKLRKFIEGWPYPNSSQQPGKTLPQYLRDMGPDLGRGAWAGVVAGAFWGAVSSIVYVFLFRAYFLAQWIHANYDTWLGSLSGGGSLHLQGVMFLVVYGPMLFAGWCAKYLGGIGLLVGIVLATAIARGIASKESQELATIWPGATMLLVLGSPILATSATRHELMALAGLSAVIWGIPGLVLGVLAPLLRGPAHHPPVWGLVATAAAAVMVAVTMTRLQAADASKTEKGLLIFATGALVLLALWLFQGRWAEEFWLFVALCVGLVVFGTTRVAQKVNLFAMQKNAHLLIKLPVATAPTPLSPEEELRIAPLLNFGQQQLVLFPNGTFFNLVPGGMATLFLANPCVAARSFTPEQRDAFVADLQKTAARDMQDASDALTSTQSNAQHFQEFQRQWQAALDQAYSKLSAGTAEKQITEARNRLGTLADLDRKRDRWRRWAATKVDTTASGTGAPATLCQSDLDNLLADLSRAGQHRVTAEQNLAALKQRVAAGLPPERPLQDAETYVGNLRETLQVGQAQRLELAMTTSLGFWVTIGLLAMWRLSHPEPNQPEPNS
jgi:hypothetical protein